MSYSILRITTYYKEYIDGYYRKFPELMQKSYADQYKHITSNSVESVSSFSKHFHKIGVRAVDIITNAASLQHAWASENNCSPVLSFEELVLQQVHIMRPDIVWIDDTRLFNKNWITTLRKQNSFLKIVTGHICAPYNSVMADSLPELDMMFTCTPCIQKDMNEQGVTTHLLYHSFDSDVLPLIETDNTYNSHNLLFTGSLYLGFNNHNQRIKALERLLSEGIKVSLYGNIETRSKVWMKQAMYIILNFLRLLKLDFLIPKIQILNRNKDYGRQWINYYSSKLRAAVKSPLFGLDMLKLMNKSNMVFNIHGDFGSASCAGNIRLFEATGVGSCLITDYKNNISELFIPDVEVVTYRSMDEMVQKVKHLNAHPEEAKRISKAGQMRTLKDHTVEQRVALLNGIFVKKLESISGV